MRRLLALSLTLAAAVPAASAVPPAADAASIATAPVRTVSAGQGHIGYRAVGKGSPVVLVMGLSGTMDAWSPTFVDRLAAAGHRVITFDNEGIGRTTLGRGDLTIKRMAADTASLIRALKLKRADVLGWSMGGMIAQATAIRYPKRVRRVVLAATAPGDGKAVAPSTDVITALSGGAANDPNAALGLLGLLFPPGQEAALNAYVGDIVKYPNFRPGASAAITRAQFGATSAWMIGRDPASASPAKIKQRVLVGGGADDRVLPIANTRHLADAAPHATLKVYPGAGHGFLFQGPEFGAEVVRFLR